jgi:hypothetical protein
MNGKLTLRALIVVAALTGGMPPSALAQAPADTWPRTAQLADATVVIYQPQVESWNGNQIQLRTAASVQPAGAARASFGSVYATARTEVDRATRTVIFNDMVITRSNFPTLPEQGAGFASELQARLATTSRIMSLDRVEASLKEAGVKIPSFPILNTPPRIIVSNTPAILVPIDGAPVLKPVPNSSRFQRVINTRALILQGGFGDSFYLHVYDGWMSADSIDGPWAKASRTPWGMEDVANQIAATERVDMLYGDVNAYPAPSLSRNVPTIYTSQVPAELIVFRGNPNFVPIAENLLWASNTKADVFIDMTSNNYFVLLSGRWFQAQGTDGPWTFVPSNALPPGFSKIPTTSPAAVVLAAVAGTPQAQEALIANSIPQTATVPLTGGPSFTPSFDGPPSFQPIVGTPLASTINSPVPVIQVDPNNYYAVSSGVWFFAPTVTGPWSVATSVPDVIYTIPTSSSLHYVTYVRVYGSTPEVVYVGYTPGYMGTVVGPYGTVVYGTGYTYPAYVGSVWYPPPYTYSVAAVPVYGAAVGFTYGYATALATAAWVTPYYGAAYHPYPCCGSATASVYGQYGNTAYSGTKTAYSSGGVTGVSSSGNYYNRATGTSGTYSTNQSYNANTNTGKQSASMTGTGAAGGSGSASANRSYDYSTGQRSGGSSLSATAADGSSIQHSGSTTAGPQGYDHTGSTSTYNANTGESRSWGGGSGASDGSRWGGGSGASGGSRWSGFSRDGGGGGFGGFSRGGESGGGGFSRGGGRR